MMLSFCGFRENHRGGSCTYMYVIWKVEYTLVWSIPFATLLYLSKTSKNSYPVHPNELDLFRRLASPWCPHILKSFEDRLHFKEYQKWAVMRSVKWHGWLVFTTQWLAMQHLTTMVEWAPSHSIRPTDSFTSQVDLAELLDHWRWGHHTPLKWGEHHWPPDISQVSLLAIRSHIVNRLLYFSECFDQLIRY